MNRLYFGDNLEVLRGTHIHDQSVDLVYLDPPFNSKAEYNVLFRSPRDDKASAQAGAFLDTWSWGEEAERSFDDIMTLGGGTARFIESLRSALGESDMMAYLVMMASRLHVLHAKLKSTGSLYLHCDPTASHYLKVVLDGIFGAQNFRNEIIWQRTNAHSTSKQFGRVHDTLLFYTKSQSSVWHSQFQPYSPQQMKRYKRDDHGRLYTCQDLTASRPDSNSGKFEWRGTMPSVGRGWGYTREQLEQWWKEGRIATRRDGKPRMDGLIVYLDEMPGKPLQSVWTDIPRISNTSAERLGYPTQKPIALLERIIRASTDEGAIVLDPFCGCGTTIDAAQRLGRQWIGIDIAVHAIKVIEARMTENYSAAAKYKEEGIPKDFESAARLAAQNKYQFQWWANYLFNPHALREQKKGKDRGVDGELFFPNGPGKPWGRMLTSVKGGDNVGPAMVRDFAGTLSREKADMGLFICLYRPTREMTREAAAAGIASTVHGRIPKLQIVAIQDWFENKLPQLPPLEHLPSAALSTSRRRLPETARPDPDQPELPLSFAGAKAKGIVHINRQMVRADAVAA